ncbi:Crp/Fnr family transcriptional regulator [Bradyrhizobium zhanjiangense]|uniref:Crp/Fnr family transcriptional regulator n=1 Tax=Bradyrhizobium zhanjiangense TaxID=1325107 RepID=A0A4Q0Q5K3_9BRAD|nr:Crp/Fnr family transcriptional regulator [Bradyrhizobium zhanjiangense]RXG83876.1 Crp/Fnr family transcriptional regulator [Bradyrhizobium zhanjiangense]
MSQEQSNLSTPSLTGGGHHSIRSSVKNGILRGLSLQHLAEVARYLEPIILRERLILQESRRPLDYVYFIESGLVSLRVVASGGILETAVVGPRGAVGASPVVGGNLSTYQSAVLFAGMAYRIRVTDLHRVMDDYPDIKEQLTRYVQALELHCAQAGFCGVRHDREKRIASWLCLASNAIDSNVLPVTHDYLSTALGLRRASVTETLLRFEKQGLIRKMRGILQIGDRACLEQRACCCYKLISSAYGLPQVHDYSSVDQRGVALTLAKRTPSTSNFVG